MHLASLQARDKVTSQTLTAHAERMSAIQALTWSHEQAIQDVGIAAKKVKQDLLELGGERLATSHVLDRADGNLRDLVEELKQPHTSLDGKEARIKSPRDPCGHSRYRAELVRRQARSDVRAGPNPIRHDQGSRGSCRVSGFNQRRTAKVHRFHDCKVSDSVPHKH